jgi:hypothetical protein
MQGHFCPINIDQDGIHCAKGDGQQTRGTFESPRRAAHRKAIGQMPLFFEIAQTLWTLQGLEGEKQDGGGGPQRPGGNRKLADLPANSY